MTYNDTRQKTRNAVLTVDGQEKHVASVSVSLRPGRSLSISVDVPNDVKLTDKQRADIAAGFKAFLAECVNEAIAEGVPVPAMAE